MYKFLKTVKEVSERNTGFHIGTNPIFSQFIRRVRERHFEQKY